MKRLRFFIIFLLSWTSVSIYAAAIIPAPLCINHQWVSSDSTWSTYGQSIPCDTNYPLTLVHVQYLMDNKTQPPHMVVSFLDTAEPGTYVKFQSVSYQPANGSWQGNNLPHPPAGCPSLDVDFFTNGDNCSIQPVTK